MTRRADERQIVWALLVEHGTDVRDDLTLYWHETDAIEAAWLALDRSPSIDDPTGSDELAATIQRSNGDPDSNRHITLALLPIEGNQHFKGEGDERPRCLACREPIELDEPHDPDSWVHTDDANYFGDHTAERGR